MNNRRRGRLVLTVLLLAAFTLITLDYRSGALGGIRSGASSVFGPVENAVHSVVSPVGSFFSSLGHLSSYRSTNDKLRAEVSKLQEQQRLSAGQQSRLAQLQRLLHLAGTAQFTIVAADVTGYGGSLGFEQTATIDRGSASGVRPNQTVIDGDGLVGRVKSVGRSSSTILLVDDPSVRVPVRLEGSREFGYVQGAGRGTPLTLTVFNGNAPLSVGERIVSFGSLGNRPFVPEVPVGYISVVQRQASGQGRTATVVPYVDYTAVDQVAVVLAAPKTLKHDSLLPPSPTPAPTVTVTVTARPKPARSGGTASPRSTPTPTP